MILVAFRVVSTLAFFAWGGLILWCVPASTRLLVDRKSPRPYDPMRLIVALCNVPCVAFAGTRMAFGSHAERFGPNEMGARIVLYVFAVACVALTIYVVRRYERMAG